MYVSLSFSSGLCSESIFSSSSNLDLESEAVSFLGLSSLSKSWPYLASSIPKKKTVRNRERGRDIQMGRKRSNRGGDAGTGMCGGGGDAWMSNEQGWCGGGCDSGKANKRTSCGGGDAGTATNGGRVVVVVMVSLASCFVCGYF